MGFFADLFKPKAQPEEDAKRSAQLMERLKARRGQETGKWLALMESASNRVPPPAGPPPTIEDIDQRETLDDEPYAPPLEAQYANLSDIAPAGSLPEAAQQNQTVAGVEKLFAEFQRQANEFNTSAAGTQLMLIVHPPAFTFEEPNYEESRNPVQKISVFKGHIVAQHWAMLVQGYQDKVDIYVIAADEILNFTLNDIRKAGIRPFMTIESSMVDGKRVWNVSDTRISLETLPFLAKELLGDLIRISTGTMSEEELFADHQTGLKLGETVAHGYKPTES